MANNVYTVVSIEASKKLIKNFVDKIFTPEVEEADWQKKSDLLADNLYGLLYKDYPKDNLTRDWMTENVGAKWCFVHDWQIDDDIIDLTFDSAWYPPEELFHELQIGLQSEENLKWKLEVKMKRIYMFQEDMLIRTVLNL